MENIFKMRLISVGAILLLAGCSKDGSPVVEAGGRNGTGDIRFEIGFAPQTRVATDAGFNSAWEDGDQIGIFASQYSPGGTGQLSAVAEENYINNVRLTYSSANGGSWSLDDGVELWWPGGNRVLDFYAYSPYHAEANNPTAIAFNVKTDQSAITGGRSNYALSELLTAKSDNSGSGWTKGSTVALRFSHALAMVQVKVPHQGEGFGPSENLTVTLREIRSGALLNLANINNASPGSEITVPVTNNNTTEITMCRVEQGTDPGYEYIYTYRALVPPQEVVEGKRVFWFEHEERQLFTDVPLVQSLRLIAGQAEIFERTLPQAIHTVAIPAGTFLMGSSNGTNIGGSGLNTSPKEPDRESASETQHRVTLTKAFYMGKYEVTNAQYAEFLNEKGIGNPAIAMVEDYGVQTLIVASSNSGDWGLHWNDSKWEPVDGYENHPVINVSWYGAVAFAQWVGGTLPTEAQWEYACRAGMENKPFGISTGYVLDNTLANFAWPYSWSWDGSSGTAVIRSTGAYPDSPSIVGHFEANVWGLYDMHGNVYEWCSDWFSDNYGSGNAANDATDPVGPSTGTTRVLRGGNWLTDGKACRSANRSASDPGQKLYYIGFRVAFVI